MSLAGLSPSRRAGDHNVPTAAILDHFSTEVTNCLGQSHQLGLVPLVGDEGHSEHGWLVPATEMVYFPLQKTPLGKSIPGEASAWLHWCEITKLKGRKSFVT